MILVVPQSVKQSTNFEVPFWKEILWTRTQFDSTVKQICDLLLGNQAMLGIFLCGNDAGSDRVETGGAGVWVLASCCQGTPI